jgi:hypothetical protein
MSAKKILVGLIAATTVIFSGLFLVSREFGLAVCSLAIGAIWLFQATRTIESSGSLFFLAFLGLAIWGSLRDLPGPAMLLAFSTNLAAWDLARFMDRTRAINGTGNIDSVMESRHLQRLGVTVSVGFVIALLPLMVNLSVNFVGLACVALLAMFMLRQAVIYLRSERQAGR